MASGSLQEKWRDRDGRDTSVRKRYVAVLPLTPAPRTACRSGRGS